MDHSKLIIEDICCYSDNKFKYCFEFLTILNMKLQSHVNVYNICSEEIKIFQFLIPFYNVLATTKIRSLNIKQNLILNNIIEILTEALTMLKQNKKLLRQGSKYSFIYDLKFDEIESKIESLEAIIDQY